MTRFLAAFLALLVAVLIPPLQASYCVRGWSCFVLSRVHGTLSITSKIKMAKVIVSLNSFGWNVCVLRITGHLTVAPFSLMER